MAALVAAVAMWAAALLVCQRTGRPRLRLVMWPAQRLHQVGGALGVVTSGCSVGVCDVVWLYVKENVKVGEDTIWRCVCM